MGYHTRFGTQITDFWPDDTDTRIYIDGNFGGERLAEILEKIQEKWPGVSAENIRIIPEKIQTRCIGYDLYDATDWTDFIIIERIEGA